MIPNPATPRSKIIGLQSPPRESRGRPWGPSDLQSPEAITIANRNNNNNNNTTNNNNNNNNNNFIIIIIVIIIIINIMIIITNNEMTTIMYNNVMFSVRSFASPRA